MLAHHKHITNWLLVGLAALFLLVMMATVAQRPNLIKTLPFYAPTATPTPISSGAITITSPKTDEHVGQTFTVTGKARVTQNVVSLRLVDKERGITIFEANAVTDAQHPGEEGNFTAQLQITSEETRSEAPLLLEVFQKDPLSGKEQDKIVIPLTFSPTGN